MKGVKIHVEATIEDFAQLIINREATYISLKNQIETCFKEKVKKELFKKLNKAIARVHKNLTSDEILFYILIPSRKMHGFSKKYSFDVVKERKLGFKRRVNQYYMYSVFGHFIYIIIFLFFMVINFS